MGSDSDSDYAANFRARHTCTDFPCAVLFLVTLGALGYLVKWADDVSDLARLSQGIDKDNKICGYNSDFAGSPDPAKGIPAKPFMYFCAQKVVPQVDGVADSKIQVVVNYEVPVCVAECPSQMATVISECPVGTDDVVQESYETTPVQGRFCLPKKDAHIQLATAAVEQKADTEEAKGMSDKWEKLANDEFGLKHGKTVLVVTFLFSIVGGYAYLFLLRMFAKCLVYVMIVGSIVSLAALGCVCWIYQGEQGVAAAAVEAEAAAAGQDPESVNQYFKWCAILCWVLAGVVLIATFCLRSAIATSVACIQCGARVIFKMPCLLLAPFKKAFMKVILWLILLVGALHIAALGTVNGRGFMRWIDFNDETNPNTQHFQYMVIFYMFGSFWILEFVNALYQFSIAYAVGFYYFSEPDEDDDRDVPCLVLQEGACLGMTKHMGSLAFGSCIIAILQTIQWIIRWMAAKNEEGGGNPVIRLVLRVFMCCCWCVEKVIGFINKNVYIDIAITGDHTFCSGLLNVVKVIVDHGRAMGILVMANFLYKVSGIAILMGGSGGIAWSMLEMDHYKKDDSPTKVEGPEFLIGMSMLVAFTIAYAFMEVFGMTTDTLLYCFATDKANNDGHVTTAPAEFLSLYNDAEEILHKRAKKREKLLKKKGMQ